MIDINDKDLLSIYEKEIIELITEDLKEIESKLEDRKDVDYCLSDAIYNATEYKFEYCIDLDFIQELDIVLKKIEKDVKFLSQAKTEVNGSDIDLVMDNPYKSKDAEISEYVKRELKRITNKPDAKFAAIEYVLDGEDYYFMLSYLNHEKDKKLKQRLAKFVSKESVVYFQRIKDLSIDNRLCSIKAKTKFYSLM